MFTPLLIFCLCIVILMVLVSVAFITLFERKILGYLQNRFGPNKLGILGIMQPISDAVKLFSKEMSFLYLINFNIFYFFVVISLFLMLIYWQFFYFKKISIFNLTFLIILIISSMSVYVILNTGWSSNSKYSLLGSYRAVAQVISYEVSLSLIIFSFLIFVYSYNLKIFLYFYSFKFNFKINMFILLLIIWIISILAEVSRSPFDFSEGESELVSGFNTEYGGGLFAILFMAEYGNILFFCYLTCLIMFDDLFWYMMILTLFMIFRGTYPRYRYDLLMMLLWKDILPFIIYYFLFIYLFLIFM